jgi:hypothetical protein
MNPSAMKIPSALDSMPFAARLCLGASLCGLLFGALAGIFLDGSKFSGSADSWETLPPLADVPVENLAALLRDSGLWDSGADTVAVDDAVLPGRPGAFKYLKLIAIIEDDSRSAVMRLAGEGRADLAKESILLPMNGDLVQVRQGEAIFEGWVLAELGPTRLRFESVASTDSADSVEYDLFGEF